MPIQKANILIVDDRPENLRAMKVTLAPLEEVEIHTALTGNDALSLMLEHEFAVVLMDVQMPEMDGFETAALMQNHPATRNIPIIFITAISKDDEHVFKGYESGAVDYLFKPVNHEILLGKVRVFLNLYRQRVECEKMQKEIQKIRNLEALGVLAGGIAHDFNNLMTAVFANVELARLKSTPGSKVYEMLTDTLKAAEQTRQLTQQLVIFSKSDLSAKEYADIAELLTESCSQYCSGTNLAYDIEVNAEITQVKIDKQQFNQVFQNLIMNAKEAMPKGGNLRIRITNVSTEKDPLPSHIRKGSYVRILFADNGPGMEEEILANIFDPYFSTKEKGPSRGQGLGLTIVHSIIQKHCGYIIAESPSGEGASFTLYLPLERQAAEKNPETGQVQEEPPHEQAADKKLLVLEDEKMVADVLVEMLRCLGYTATVVENSDEAVAVYKRAMKTSAPFTGAILELIIKDGERGEQVLDRLKTVDPEVKAIVFSGYADDQTFHHYHEAGFDGMIKKPFTLSALAEELEHLG